MFGVIDVLEVLFMLKIFLVYIIMYAYSKNLEF